MNHQQAAFAALFDARAVKIAQPSVTKVGGITEFRKVASVYYARSAVMMLRSSF